MNIIGIHEDIDTFVKAIFNKSSDVREYLPHVSLRLGGLALIAASVGLGLFGVFGNPLLIKPALALFAAGNLMRSVGTGMFIENFFEDTDLSSMTVLHGALALGAIAGLTFAPTP